MKNLNLKHRTFLADDLDSVIKVNYDIDCKNDLNRNYIGVKNSEVIPINFLNSLFKDKYKILTIDKMANKGRAIDIELKNPITGRFMTGSSSGTAINVFLGINDIGIGTDGGGSVLAPACALNLYGFISKDICKPHLIQFQKESTDNISFTPSIGYISKDINLIKELADLTISRDEISSNYKVKIAKPKNKYQLKEFERIKQLAGHEEVHLSYNGLDRKEMMLELSKFDFNKEILVTFEGPIDLFGYGDSIIGGFGTYSRQIQENGYKFYLKVINMLGLTAIIIPSTQLSLGTLLIGNTDSLDFLFSLAKKLSIQNNELVEKYFS